MRMLFVTNFPSYHQVDLFNAMAAAGMDIHVLYLRSITPGRQWQTLRPISHPHTFAAEYKISGAWYLNSGVHQVLRAVRPSLVIITQYASITMQSLMWELSVRGRPWIFWSEAPGVKFSENPVLPSARASSLLRRTALAGVKHACEIWAIGTTAVDAYAKGTNRSVLNVPYFFDTDPFRIVRRAPGGEVVRFLFSGKLIVRKGIDVLLAACRLLDQRQRDYRLSVLGDGVMRDAVEQSAMSSEGRIRRLGFVELADVPGVYSEHDVLVFPSRYDGWGMAVVEALASGMPVIATTATGAAVDADVSRAGSLISAESAEALADAMERYLDSPLLVSRQAAIARATGIKYDAKAGAEVLWRAAGDALC